MYLLSILIYKYLLLLILISFRLYIHPIIYQFPVLLEPILIIVLHFTNLSKDLWIVLEETPNILAK